jgi:hypothetical protein
MSIGKIMKRVIFTFIILLVAVKVNATITVTEPANYKVYQRNGTSVNITFSGTYSSPPDPIGVIEYRIVDNGTNNAVSGHDWQTLDASPAGGTFSGTARSVTLGSWYNIDVRCDVCALIERKSRVTTQIYLSTHVQVVTRPYEVVGSHMSMVRELPAVL